MLDFSKSLWPAAEAWIPHIKVAKGHAPGQLHRCYNGEKDAAAAAAAAGRAAGLGTAGPSQGDLTTALAAGELNILEEHVLTLNL